MYLSVIIPAYNEEKRIKKTLIDVDFHLREKGFEYEILVVNDGSYDRTEEVVERFCGTILNLRLISLKENKGKGFAVKTGMKAAKGEYKLFMDADNSTSINHLDDFLPYMEKFDIVISSRQTAESKLIIPQPITRRVLGVVWRMLVRIIVPLGVKDSQNGFKLFKREAANFLFAKQTTSRWAFDVEILALARKFGFKVKEVGIEWHNDRESKNSLRGMISMLKELGSIRLKLWTKKYD